MSTRLAPGRDDCRTTDHSDEIARMRDLATEIQERYPDVNACPNEPLLQGRLAGGAQGRRLRRHPVPRSEAVVLQCAATLLEVHDATGISLDDWTGPHECVIQGLLIAGYERDAFLPNGV